MNISAKTKLCVIIGDPVEHSLSPAMHNAGYEALGIDDQFVFTACRVKAEHVKDVMQAMRAMHIRGISCTIPHKTEVMKYLDEIDPVAKIIGAVNTVVNDGGVLKGYNTDWLGIVTPLEMCTPLKGKTVALIGAGGAARAMAYAVTSKGAKLTIYNRTIETARKLADEFSGKASPIDNNEHIKNADIILNATSVGMHPNTDESPVNSEYISSTHIVFDAVYSPYETKLLKDAKGKGAQIIHGTEMLLYQGIEQFKLYTGHDAPVEAMRNAIHNSLSWQETCLRRQGAG